MAYLLFPGRHIITTAFQREYLLQTLRLPIEKLDVIGDTSMDDGEIDTVIFAVTSANQQHSRYNPVPFHVRTIQLDRFAHDFKEMLGVSYRIVGVPHFPPTDRFAEFTLKEVEAQLDTENVSLSPANTIVLCSTAPVMKLYRDMGFNILPAEYDPEAETYQHATPVEIVRQVIETDEADALEKVSASTREVWADFPGVFETIRQLWTDPLLTDEGSLTETRNYSTYALGMAHGPLLELKYGDIKEAIVPGRIVDEGCADGALLLPIARDFPDSDLIGIEITGEFIARCKERQRAGEFGGSYVHFYQRNILEKVFADNSIDTAICNSTLHELYSYAGGSDAVRSYLGLKYDQLRPGGQLVIRDVVGPENKEREVYLWCNSDDGSSEDIFADIDEQEALAEHLNNLSTYARFKRFARDYLPQQEGEMAYQEVERGGTTYIVLRLKDAMEFMTTKDYTDNWDSEMHEEFAFWSFPEWKSELSNAGFEVVENPNEPSAGSRAYTNSWVADNRFDGKVALYENNEAVGTLMQMAYPVTNMVLVGRRPGSAL